MANWAKDTMGHHRPPGGGPCAGMSTDLHEYGAAVTRTQVAAAHAALTARAATLEPGTSPAVIAAHLAGLLELPHPTYTSDRGQS